MYSYLHFLFAQFPVTCPVRQWTSFVPTFSSFVGEKNDRHDVSKVSIELSISSVACSPLISAVKLPASFCHNQSVILLRNYVNSQIVLQTGEIKCKVDVMGRTPPVL